MQKLFLCSSIFLILCASSCINKGDLFDENYSSELKTTIPEGFTWNMTQSVDAVIETVDDYNGKFLFNVRIYTENPSTNPQVKPVAVGLANMNEPFIQTIVIPQSTNKLYVVQTLNDPDGTEISVASSIVDVKDISKVKLSRSGSRSSSLSGQLLTDKDLCGDKIGDLTEYKLIDSIGAKTSDFHANEKYKIEKSCDILVDTENLNQCNIYIYPNAQVHFIQQNGQNGFSVGSSTELYNDGCIYVYSDNTKNKLANLYIKEGANVYSNGCINCNVFDFKGNNHGVPNIRLFKYSYINCYNLNISAGHITMDKGCFIETNILSTQGGLEGDISIASINNETVGNVDGFNYAALLVIKDCIEDEKNKIKITGNSSAQILVQCAESESKKITNATNVSFYEDATAEIYIPASSCNDGFGGKEKELESITYCMEDQYPEKGDFDMNDIVVEITPSVVLFGSNETAKVNIACKIIAVGASKTISGFVDIDGVETQLFENAHSVMKSSGFINTDRNIAKIDPVTITKKDLECKSGFNYNNLKFFIKAGEEKIYSADQGGINQNNKLIIGGIRVPKGDFKYPLEHVNITEAFNENNYEIAKWISSDLKECEDWYNHPINEKCF